MSTATSTAIAKPEATALVKILNQYRPHELAKLDDVSRAFAVAEGVKTVRAAVEAVIDRILPLQGSSLGFRTDKDRDGGYPKQVVIDCAAEALLRGLRFTGNEWNIIGGRCYVAQAGCARLVGDYPGLTDLEHAPGVPVMKDGGAIVEYTIRWNLDGKPMSLTRLVPVRVNANMSMDAILGKAKRKMLAAVYERLTGSALSEGDAEDATVPMNSLPAPQSQPEAKLDRVGTYLADIEATKTVEELKSFVDRFNAENKAKPIPDDDRDRIHVRVRERKAVLTAEAAVQTPAPAPAQPEAFPLTDSPEGEQSADPTKASAPTASTPSANASATSPVPTAGNREPSAPAPTTQPSSTPTNSATDAPRVGAQLVQILLTLMHEVDVNWAQLRDATEGKGADIAKTCGIVGRPGMRVNELPAETALKLRDELQKRVKAKQERAEKREAKKEEKAGVA